MTVVLVDTSVWVSHFRYANAALMELLMRDRVATHPLVAGEIACGTPPERQRTLANLQRLQQAQQATTHEVMAFIDREQLFGHGCGWIDLALLASTLLTPAVRLWTLDRRLGALAARFGVVYEPPVG
ncbi:PIN domain-containing protein [Melaminivora sp.]|uniref:PIN domain-containing protein n=1 Tax=Melaminivora sp. TaxID=1933032 RepID=UPI0028AE1AC1|nr:PIN domain-containing protein [Melaminivora sp.]